MHTSSSTAAQRVRTSIVATICAGVLVFTGAVQAQAAPDASVQGTLTTYDTVQGRAVPVPGITVAVEAPDALGTAIASTTTDAQGEFSITGIEPGDYAVSAQDLRAGSANSGITRQFFGSYDARPQLVTAESGSGYTVERWDAFRGGGITVAVPSDCDAPGATIRAELISSPQFPPFALHPTQPVVPPTTSGGVVRFTGLHANGETYAVRVLTTGARGVCSRVVGPVIPTAGQVTDLGSVELRRSGAGIDFTGDAHSDVVVRTSGGDLLAYPGNGTGGWLPTQQIGSGWQGMNLMFNATGFGAVGEPDILARDGAGDLYLFRGHGMPGTGWMRTNVKVGQGWDVMSAVFSPGDFTGDGTPDVLARDGAGSLWLYPGNGDSGFAARRLVGTGWNVFDSIVAGDDLNGDGRQDVLARTPDGILHAYYSNGRGGWSTGRAVVVGQGWDIFSAIINAGDFDGDGRADILARDAGSGNLVMYRPDGRGAWLDGGRGRVVGRGWGGLTFLD